MASAKPPYPDVASPASTTTSSEEPRGSDRRRADTSSNEQPVTKKPRRRRCPSVSAGEVPQKQTFYFVDTNSSSREKRAHVMRHHIQEKRKQHKASSTAKDKQQSRTLQSLQWQKKPTPAAEVPEESNAFPRNDFRAYSGYSSTRFPPLIPHPPPQVPVASPVTMLDASRKDPFGTLPIGFGRDDLALADYWTTKLTYWSGQNPHIKKQVFRNAMRYPLAFRAVILAYCARWKVQLYNLQDSRQVRHHVGESTRIINETLRGAVQTDEDCLALALTGLALSEERFGSRKAAEEYSKTAIQIIRPRVGSHPQNEVFLHFVRYIMAPRPTTIDVNGQRWLITFLRGAEELMMEQNTPDYLSVVPQRRDAFLMEGPLYSLLSSGPRPTVVPHDDRKYVIPNASTQEVCRTAALIYILAALWDFKESPNKTGRFLVHLAALVKEHSLDRIPACETLIWLLLEEGYDADMRDPERGWSTGELLSMHKQLPPDLQFQFNEILMSFLMLSTPIRGIDAFEEQLRRSVCIEVTE